MINVMKSYCNTTQFHNANIILYYITIVIVYSLRYPISFVKARREYEKKKKSDELHRP